MISKVILVNHGCTVTQLLVSVRNQAEAQIAMRAGVDILDIKEPNLGSLGRADGSTWFEIADLIQGQIPLSVACGELKDLYQNSPLKIPAVVSYAKVGLSGFACDPNWIDVWNEWRTSLDDRLQPVAVAYADEFNADSPSVDDVAHQTIENGVGTLLIDTFRKDGSTLFDHLSRSDVSQLVKLTRHHEVQLVIGGSIQSTDIAKLIDLNVDIVAVRGAVCSSARETPLDPIKVKHLVNMIVSYKQSTDDSVHASKQNAI